jgi:hypothetical protein
MKWGAVDKHVSIHIDGAVMEQVESFKVLGVQITKDLKWYTRTLTKAKYLALVEHGPHSWVALSG